MATQHPGQVSDKPVIIPQEMVELSSQAPSTQILPICVDDLGSFIHSVKSSFQHPWSLALGDSVSAASLRTAAAQLRDGGFPVAFPTETVYGLAADATSSKAVRGIYQAKQRPADNPLIVHFSSLDQLRSLLDPKWPCPPLNPGAELSNDPENFVRSDPIPSIYLPLIQRFWPGPLTILLPLPTPSPLAPEVTNSLKTFGARMPSSLLALALIQHTGLPLAAPSANTSTKPSPTTAQHVFEDMNGRILTILDGGPCEVGVESTVVDGLSNPPCILRPGGISINELRTCPGWENVENAYYTSETNHHGNSGTRANGIQDATSPDTMPGGKEFLSEEAPRAPGMKYRHYAPRAHVVLVDATAWHRIGDLLEGANAQGKKAGVIRTRSKPDAISDKRSFENQQEVNGVALHAKKMEGTEEVFIGPSLRDIARGLFAALRDLDGRQVDVIFVEGIDADDGETAAAIMNRVRKAAGERITA